MNIAGMTEMSNPAMVGICRLKNVKYGSVTVIIGRRMGNCRGNWGNQLNAILLPRQRKF